MILEATMEADRDSTNGRAVDKSTFLESIGIQVNPELMIVGKVGGVRATRRAGDDELRYMDGTNTLNAASQQLQSLSLNGMAFSIGLRKRITGGRRNRNGMS